MRNRPPPPPEGTPLQETPTWPGPPSAPPPQKEEEDQQRRQDRWDRRERAMECTSKNAHQGNGEIREGKREDPSGNQPVVYFFARFFEKKQVASCQLQKTRGRMGYSWFAVIELTRAIEVADATCFATNPQNNRMSYRELQEAIEYMKERRSGLQEIESPRERGGLERQDLGDGKRAVRRRRRRHEDAHGGKR